MSNDNSPFGYSIDREPVVRSETRPDRWYLANGEWWNTPDVTPAQVAGPGEVVMWREDVEYAANYAAFRHTNAAKRLRVALDASEPADDGQPTGKPQHWTEAFGLIERAELRVVQGIVAAIRGRADECEFQNDDLAAAHEYRILASYIETGSKR